MDNKDFLSWLHKMTKAKETLGQKEAVKEFVNQLHKLDKLYHFDDDPLDITNEKNERLFTDEEADLVGRIVAQLYCDEMFEIAVKLLNMESLDG